MYLPVCLSAGLIFVLSSLRECLLDSLFACLNVSLFESVRFLFACLLACYIAVSSFLLSIGCIILFPFVRVFLCACLCI